MDEHTETKKPHIDPATVQWRHPSRPADAKYLAHDVIKYAHSSLYGGNIAVKQAKWRKFLELVKEGKRTPVALRGSGFSAGMWHVWNHACPERAKEYAEAIGDRARPLKYYTHAQIRQVIALIGEQGYKQAFEKAEISHGYFGYFLRLFPELRQEYELEIGRPYRWIRPLTEEHWSRFFLLLPVMGLHRAASFASHDQWSIRGTVAHRMTYDPDFRAAAHAVWKKRAPFSPTFPYPPQVDEFLALLPEVGLMERAAALAGIPPETVWEMRALNLTLEQQVIEQLREYDRRRHPYYRRWSKTDEAHGPFESLYQQVYVREAAYQQCVQQEAYDEECRQAQFRVDPTAKQSFAERHGLLLPT